MTYFSILILNIVGLFNEKVKKGIEGRRFTFEKLKSNLPENNKTIWMHCASLGEYEQGVPVLEKLKLKFTNHQIVVSFFSPSGYEHKKNTDLADVVVYLPWDTKKNASKFLNLIQPEIVVFVKYDLWPNYLNEIKRRKINAVLISAVFRNNQPYFKWYGRFMASSLFAFQHIFVQDYSSEELLKNINYSAITVIGDTRFDRVLAQLDQRNSIDVVAKFKGDHLCVVLGSTWPEDDQLIFPTINSQVNVKYIIAPHNIKNSYISEIEKQLVVPYVRYSKMDVSKLKSAKVFILDTIGLLSKTYSYADISYVGGAAGKTGLHNILEPAVFSCPIMIGKNYKKFPEAIQLIKLGGVISIANKYEFDTYLMKLVNDQNLRSKIGSINKEFTETSKGATNKIIKYFET